MKKINLSEAENIVGGTFVCTREFACGQRQQPHLPAGENLCEQIRWRTEVLLPGAGSKLPV